MRRGMRVLRIIFVLFVMANVIEIVDQSGIAEQQPAVAATAQATRALLSGDLSVGLPQEFEYIVKLASQVTASFDEVSGALD